MIMEEASCPQRSYDYAYANPAQVINSLILILFYSYIYLVIYVFSLTFTVFSRVNWRWIHDDGIRSLLPRGKLRFRLHKPRTNNKFFLKIWSCSFHLSLCLFIYLFSLLSKVLFRGNWHSEILLLLEEYILPLNHSDWAFFGLLGKRPQRHAPFHFKTLKILVSWPQSSWGHFFLNYR